MLGRTRRAKDGIQTCVKPPFGFIIVTKDDVVKGTYPTELRGKYLIHPENAAIVKEIFERVAGRESLNSVARWLQSFEIPNSLGKPKSWQAAHIKLIINNPAYHGLAAFGRTKTIRDESRAAKGLNRTYDVKVPEEDWIRIPCPEIVSQQLWQKTNQVVQDNKDKLSTRIEFRQLLTSLLRCPKCGRVMTGRARSRGKVSHYKCREAFASSNAAGRICWPKIVLIHRMDSLVIEAIKTALQNPKAVEAAYEAHTSGLKSEFSKTEIDELKKKIEVVVRKERSTTQAQIEAITNGLDSGIYISILRELALERTALTTRLSTMERALKSTSKPQDRAAVIKEGISAVESVLEASDDLISRSDKNAILRKVVKSVVPFEDDVAKATITFVPFDKETQLQIVTGIGIKPKVEVVSTDQT